MKLIGSQQMMPVLGFLLLQSPGPKATLTWGRRVLLRTFSSTSREDVSAGIKAEIEEQVVEEHCSTLLPAQGVAPPTMSFCNTR